MRDMEQHGEIAYVPQTRAIIAQLNQTNKLCELELKHSTNIYYPFKTLLIMNKAGYYDKFRKIELDEREIINSAGEKVQMPAAIEYQTNCELVSVGTWNEKLVNSNGAKFIINTIKFPLADGSTRNVTALCYEKNYDPSKRREDQHKDPLTKGTSYLTTMRWDEQGNLQLQMSHLTGGERLTTADIQDSFAAMGLPVPEHAKIKITEPVSEEDVETTKAAEQAATAGAPDNA